MYVLDQQATFIKIDAKSEKNILDCDFNVILT